ncbi:hypothetical protein BDF19DRAFT_337339, partial [Syncephalis fuscata]
YINDIDKNNLKSTANKCLLLDTGRRDLMYCVHESSTIQEPITYRYTSNQRHFDTEDKKYRRTRLKLK